MKRRRLVLLALVVALGLSTASCAFRVHVDVHNFVAENEVEQRAIDRHQASDDARNTMLFLLIVVVAPLALSAAIVFAVTWGRESSY